jgi:GT2 family glycosyltransferase
MDGQSIPGSNPIKTPLQVLENITVVIPTLGRPILEKSLYYIANGRALPGGLIVVDQSDTPEGEKWVAQLRSLGIDASHVPSRQIGRAAGVNRGLERVQTRFVAITDDDCFVDPDWLENLHTCLEENPLVIVTGRVEAAGEGISIIITSSKPAIYRHPRLVFDSMSGGNMGTSMAVIRQVGLFDESPRLRTAEDAEWSYRALRKGIPILFAPQVSVQHFGWRDEAGRVEQYRSYARSHGGFYGKYIRRGDLFILARAFIHHFRALRWWMRGKTSGDPNLASQGKAYLTGLLPGMIAGFRDGLERQL